MDKIELRVLSSSLTANDEGMVVEGLVNQTDAWSHTLGLNKRFREKINKGTFTKAINEIDRIDFLGEHRTDLLLASTENGSLELWEDNEGLKMRAKIAPTSYGKDFYTLMKEKMINHMSFGFKVKKDEWRKASDGIYERTVSDLELREVSVVRNPAYPQSAIAARGIDVVEDVEIPDDVETLDEERAIDIEALKAEIKKEVLAEMNTPKAEPEVKVEEPKQETPKEEVKVEPEAKPEEKVEVKPEPEKVVEPEVKNEDKPQVEEKVEQKTDPESKPEDKQVDNSASLVDLLQKYKELQSFK